MPKTEVSNKSKRVEPFASTELCELANFLDKKRWSEKITGWGSPGDDERLSRVVEFLRLAVLRIETGDWHEEKQ